MKICMLASSVIRSGMGGRIYNLARCLTDLGHGVRVFYNGPASPTPGVDSVFTPVIGNRYFDKGFAVFYKSIAKLEDVDIVHSFSTVPTSGVPGYLRSFLMGASWVVDWPDLEGFGGFGEQANPAQRWIVDAFERWMVSHCAGVTAISPFLGERAREYGAERVHYLPNGADLNHLGFPHEVGEEPATGADIRRELGLSDSQVILFIGLLHKSTDADFLIRSMRHVLKESPDAKLVLVGEGPKKEGFRSLARDLGVDGNIVWIGTQPQHKIRGFLEAADVVALPVRDNPANRARNPIKLTEYLAAGKAVVSNPVGIVGDIIVNGKNGVLTGFDEDEYAEGILGLLRNEELRVDIGQNAAKTARESFSWDKITVGLEEFYEELL